MPAFQPGTRTKIPAGHERLAGNDGHARQDVLELQYGFYLPHRGGIQRSHQARRPLGDWRGIPAQEIRLQGYAYSGRTVPAEGGYYLNCLYIRNVIYKIIMGCYIVAALELVTACNDNLDIQQAYPFSIETMPVPQRLKVEETAKYAASW